MTVVEGEDATFTCHVTGRPRPTIKWYYFESLSIVLNTTLPPPLNEMGGDYSIDRMEIGSRELESNLTVLNTLPSDTGYYVCVFENAVTLGMVNAALSVEGQYKTTPAKILALQALSSYSG